VLLKNRKRGKDDKQRGLRRPNPKILLREVVVTVVSFLAKYSNHLSTNHALCNMASVWLGLAYSMSTVIHHGESYSVRGRLLRYWRIMAWEPYKSQSVLLHIDAYSKPYISMRDPQKNLVLGLMKRIAP
jgi:hypothetical protein